MNIDNYRILSPGQRWGRIDWIVILCNNLQIETEGASSRPVGLLLPRGRPQPEESPGGSAAGDNNAASKQGRYRIRTHAGQRISSRICAMRRRRGRQTPPRAPDILYLLNLYTTKMARPISTTDTSMMTAVLLWTPSLVSTRGALKEKA